jgi:hypothetical protein
MKLVPGCGEREAFVDYLYDEGSPEERAQFEAHLEECRLCARELDALRGVRRELSLWSAPDAALGFKVVRESSTARSLYRRLAVAAAVILVIGGTLAVANLEIRYGSEGLTIRTGWRGPSVSSASPESGPAPWQADLAALEARLGDEIRASRAASVTADAPRTETGARSEADLLRRVRGLIDESESRQQRALALRLAQVLRDVDTQRRTDLVRIERGFGQLEGITGAEAARQRELLNYLVRVSQQR